MRVLWNTHITFFAFANESFVVVTVVVLLFVPLFFSVHYRAYFHLFFFFVFFLRKSIGIELNDIMKFWTHMKRMIPINDWKKPINLVKFLSKIRQCINNGKAELFNHENHEIFGLSHTFFKNIFQHISQNIFCCCCWKNSLEFLLELA